MLAHCRQHPQPQEMPATLGSPPHFELLESLENHIRLGFRLHCSYSHHGFQAPDNPIEAPRDSICLQCNLPHEIRSYHGIERPFHSIDEAL